MSDEKKEQHPEQTKLTDLYEKVKQERAQALQKMGYNEFFALQEGDNKITVTSDEIRTVTTKYGDKYLFPIKVKDGNKNYDLAVGANNPLLWELLQFLHGKKFPVKVNIQKTGEGKESRYLVKE